MIYRNPDGILMPDGDLVHTLYVEMKNKHNTMNSASSQKTYIKMQSQILDDDDCACLLVEAIAKKSQNIKWATKVDGKKAQHKLIRRVSIDQFYKIVTGDETAFYKMCMALPRVITSVIEEDPHQLMPKDTVIQELHEIAKEQDAPSEDLAMAMAVYMLGFGTYYGFSDGTTTAPSEQDAILRLGEYAQLSRQTNEES